MVMQYDHLRQEVLASKHNINRIMMLGITGVPVLLAALDFLKDSYAENNSFSTIVLPVVLMFAPLVPAMFFLILLYEQGTVMRVGRYIRDQPEVLYKLEDCMHWETWLSAANPSFKTRRVEILLVWATSISFFLYYVLACILGLRAARQNLSEILGEYINSFPWISSIVILYTLIGGLLIYFHIAILPVGTRKNENNCEDPESNR